MTDSPMTALNKQALREAVIHAQSTDDWGCDDNNFHDQATPDVVIALLDELEAAEKRIAELEAREVALPPTFWYEHDDLSSDIPVLDKRLVKKALSAAGIGVKGE